MLILSGRTDTRYVYLKRELEPTKTRLRFPLGTGKAHVVSARKLSVVDVAREPP